MAQDHKLTEEMVTAVHEKLKGLTSDLDKPNAKLADLLYHFDQRGPFAQVPKDELYNLLSRALARLKGTRRVKYVGGKGAGWRWVK